MGSLDVGSDDFWAGIDVACIFHYSWEGLPFAPAMDDAHIGVAVGTCVYSVAAMSFGQALTSPAFSTIVGQDCHLLQEPLAQYPVSGSNDF